MWRICNVNRNYWHTQAWWRIYVRKFGHTGVFFFFFSRNGLLLGSIKSFHDSMLTHHPLMLMVCGFHPRVINTEISIQKRNHRDINHNQNVNMTQQLESPYQWGNSFKLVTWSGNIKSTMALVMAWCLMATSHYLNQCHSPTTNVTANVQPIVPYNEFENHTFKIIAISPRGQWVNFQTHQGCPFSKYWATA